MSQSFDPESVALPVGHFIGGVFEPAESVLPMHRPSDGTGYAACPLADAATVDRAVAAAERALSTSGWATARPRDRVRSLHAWADLIEADSEALAQVEAVASTRPVGQLVAGVIAVTAEQIRFFAEFADKEDDALVPTDVVCHFAVPAARWWENIGYT